MFVEKNVMGSGRRLKSESLLTLRRADEKVGRTDKEDGESLDFWSNSLDRLTITSIKNTLSLSDDHVDWLQVFVGGHQMIPQSKTYLKVPGGQGVADANISVSFQSSIDIQFMEYNTIGDNDLKGTWVIRGGQNLEENSVRSGDYSVLGTHYVINFTVEVGKGTPEGIPDWVTCSTAQCVACNEFYCNDNNALREKYDLDRDMDYDDLQNCPEAYFGDHFHKYPQFWPVADVYLRVCMRRGGEAAARRKKKEFWK